MGQSASTPSPPVEVRSFWFVVGLVYTREEHLLNPIVPDHLNSVCSHTNALNITLSLSLLIITGKTKSEEGGYQNR